VDSIRDERIHGRIARNIQFVRGYRRGQAHTLRIPELLDWTVLRPDGTEEGNRVGNFLDSLQAQLRAGAIRKPC
jgi:hypothetical protein